ncbi:MAG: zinc-dependent metalloprotease [Balneolales bacterium]|nr:zinc-dependent metalloprotease [Balneolales bacterium]
MKSSYTLAGIISFMLLLSGCSVFRSAPAEAPQPDQRDAIERATSGNKAIEGLFTIFQDTNTGSTKMLITEDQIGKEFIYWGHTVDGVPQVGHFRGNYRDNKIFTIERYFDRLEFIVQNTSFYFDPENPLSRAESANISRSVLFSAKIETESDGRFLINSDPLFLSESLHQVKPSPFPGIPPGAMLQLGNLSRDKTKFRDIRSYPENTAVIVDYVYDNPFPLNQGGSAVTDARAITISYQHTFIEMPDNDFVPRFDDPRVGYFTQTVNDQTATGPTPWRDVINRWHLVKQDPDSPLSDPEEPIVWWIENTTPHELRPTIKEAVLRWNTAFEAAGFTNAVQVKVQPDTADWDAGDIRYNVLRWTSSPTPPFGGYGPSFTNPRTGQIIGADIMLEWVFLRNAANSEKLFSENVIDYFLSTYTADEEGKPHTHEHGMYCSLGHFMHFNNMFGFAALRALDLGEVDEERLVHDALVYLIMHEVGHTLGLNHNMAASSMLSPDQVHDRDFTMEVGLAGSVMDYPAINVALDRSQQGEFYTTVAGPYDIWAIEFGYSPALEDAEAEAARLRAILERSTEPELLFGNDADDMRAPGKAIDPRVMIGDMTNDPVAYADERVKVVRQILDNLLERYTVENQSYQELFSAFMSSMGQWGTAMNVTTRHIGGVYVDRGFAGQPGSGAPYTPVAKADQKKAMESLSRNLFAPNAFYESHEVYNHLQRQRRGFNFFATSEDPKIHDLVLGLHRNALAHLLHPNTTKRITDSRLYGNEYSLTEMMGDLTAAIFEADLRSNVNTFRQNLQIHYVTRLAGMVSPERNPYDSISRSAALYNLERIQNMMQNRSRGNSETRAHTRHIQRIIEFALEA